MFCVSSKSYQYLSERRREFNTLLLTQKMLVGDTHTNVPGIVFTIYIFVFYLRLMSQN